MLEPWNAGAGGWKPRPGVCVGGIIASVEFRPVIALVPGLPGGTIEHLDESLVGAIEPQEHAGDDRPPVTTVGADQLDVPAFEEATALIAAMETLRVQRRSHSRYESPRHRWRSLP